MGSRFGQDAGREVPGSHDEPGVGVLPTVIGGRGAGLQARRGRPGHDGQLVAVQGTGPLPLGDGQGAAGIDAPRAPR